MNGELSRFSLNGLLAIEVVARRGTLALAASELGSTPGAVSQKIIATEKRLGVRLFERTSKGLKPTALCKEITADLTRGFSRLLQATETAQGRAEGQLTISAAPIFAAHWLIWRLPRFSARHPSVQVNLMGETDLRNPDLGDVDLAIRVGKGPWPDVTCEPLFPLRYFPVCAPELAQHLKKPEDLLHVPIIRDIHALFDWDVWLNAEGLDHRQLQPGPSFSSGSLCLDAAKTGMGVFMAWETLANDAVAKGKLVAPFPEHRETGARYWLISGEDGIRSPAQRAFRKWLLEELDAEGLTAPSQSEPSGS